MNKKEIDALDRVIKYMWEDEVKHFCEMYDIEDIEFPPLRKECEKDGDHIFCSLRVLQIYLNWNKPGK